MRGERGTLVIEPVQVGAATVWHYGERVAARFASLADGCRRCRPEIPCWRHEGDTFEVEFVGYQGLRIEGDDGDMTSTGVAMSRDCGGCGARGLGGSLVVSPGRMLASACESCIRQASFSGSRGTEA